MEERNRVREWFEAPGMSSHFHAGDQPQNLPIGGEGAEPKDDELAALDAHQAAIHAPNSRPYAAWGYDEEGEPIAVPAEGLVFDPEGQRAVPAAVLEGMPGEEEEEPAEEDPVTGSPPVPPPPSPTPAPAPAPAPPTPAPGTPATTQSSTGNPPAPPSARRAPQTSD